MLGTDLPLPKRHHVLGEGSPPHIGGKIRGPKILGSMGWYRKISSYRHKILYSNYNPYDDRHRDRRNDRRADNRHV